MKNEYEKVNDFKIQEWLRANNKMLFVLSGLF